MSRWFLADRPTALVAEVRAGGRVGPGRVRAGAGRASTISRPSSHAATTFASSPGWLKLIAWAAPSVSATGRCSGAGALTSLTRCGFGMSESRSPRMPRRNRCVQEPLERGEACELAEQVQSVDRAQAQIVRDRHPSHPTVLAHPIYRELTQAAHQRLVIHPTCRGYEHEPMHSMRRSVCELGSRRGPWSCPLGRVS